MIRAATGRDTADLLKLCRQMHAESQEYNHIPFVAEDMASFLHTMISNREEYCLGVAASGGRIAGMVGAVRAPYFFNARGFFTCDTFLYVVPDVRRTLLGGRISVKLIDFYERWASAGGASPIRLGESAGINRAAVDAFYKKRGYIVCGTIYKKVH